MICNPDGMNGEKECKYLCEIPDPITFEIESCIEKYRVMFECSAVCGSHEYAN